MTDVAPPDELSLLLAKHKVSQAVVVDDVFDLTCGEFVSPEGLAAFAATVRGDATVAAELTGLGIDLPAVLRRDEAALQALAARREGCVKAGPAVEGLLGAYFERREPLDELIKHLRDLGIPAEPVGAEDDLPAGLKADIAFVDYYLEDEPPEEPDPADATDYGAVARQKAQAIYKQTRAHIILMSNRRGVRDLQAEFRTRANLLKGYFRFAAKEELTDADRLRGILSLLPLSADFRHKLHDFVDALDRRSDRIKAEFMRSVRDLGLEDYAQIRQLSLNRENHPFGDYLLRMFGAFLTSLVLEDRDIVGRVADLDKTTFESLLPVQDEPSTTLGRIYLASLTERLREPLGVPVATPPTAPEVSGPAGADGGEPVVAPAQPALGAPSGGSAEPPAVEHVEFGDLLVKDVASPVYAVMNPACDLVFRSGGREPEDTLLLLPGHLRQLHESFLGKRAPSFFTPLYLHDDHVYRIDWDYRRLTAVQHKDLRPVYLGRGYRCDRRLQLGPALELQQHFTSATSRVGMPVPPPIGRAIDIMVYCRGGGGKWAPVGAVIAGGCFVYHMRDKDQFVVSNGAKDHVLTQLAAHATALAAASGGWEGGGSRAQYLATLRQALNRWRTDFPFHRGLGTLPGGRTGEKSRSPKQCESKGGLGVAIGTALPESGKVEVDVLLCLDIGPMPLRGFETDLPREMDPL